MSKLLISIPDDLMSRLKTAVPVRQRSKVISLLIEQEIVRREKALYDDALALENDRALNDEMQAWDATVNDGLDKVD